MTQNEKENSIAFILKEANLRPVTFRAFIRSYFQEVGFRYLFWGMGDILFIVGLLNRNRDIYFPDFHYLLESDYSQQSLFYCFYGITTLLCTPVFSWDLEGKAVRNLRTKNDSARLFKGTANFTHVGV